MTDENKPEPPKRTHRYSQAVAVIRKDIEAERVRAWRNPARRETFVAGMEYAAARLDTLGALGIDPVDVPPSRPTPMKKTGERDG